MAAPKDLMQSQLSASAQPALLFSTQASARSEDIAELIRGYNFDQLTECNCSKAPRVNYEDNGVRNEFDKKIVAEALALKKSEVAILYLGAGYLKQMATITYQLAKSGISVNWIVIEPLIAMADKEEDAQANFRNMAKAQGRLQDVAPRAIDLHNQKLVMQDLLPPNFEQFAQFCTLIERKFTVKARVVAQFSSVFSFYYHHLLDKDDNVTVLKSDAKQFKDDSNFQWFHSDEDGYVSHPRILMHPMRANIVLHDLTSQYPSAQRQEPPSARLKVSNTARFAEQISLFDCKQQNDIFKNALKENKHCELLRPDIIVAIDFNDEASNAERILGSCILKLTRVMSIYHSDKPEPIIIIESPRIDERKYKCRF